jgi:hypothetical protein
MDEEKIMAWDSGFFIATNNVFRKQEQSAGVIVNGTSSTHCTGCNQPIGVVSTTLYEIDEKYYCSDCYVRKVINNAVERDHTDIKQEKEALKKSAP